MVQYTTYSMGMSPFVKGSTSLKNAYQDLREREEFEAFDSGEEWLDDDFEEDDDDWEDWEEWERCR